MFVGFRAVAGMPGSPLERVVLVAIALLGYLYGQCAFAQTNPEFSKRASP